jgi:hypothetical protein
MEEKKEKAIYFQIADKVLEKIKVKCAKEGTINKKVTIDEWISNVVSKKIKNEDVEDPNLPVRKQVKFFLSEEDENKINQRVDFVKKNASTTFSKKAWIVEAILEELYKDPSTSPDQKSIDSILSTLDEAIEEKIQEKFSNLKLSVN